MLDLLQKLKKVDPDALILNFLESDDPNIESDSSSLVSGSKLDDSSESEPKVENSRSDLFVFAAYIPPGKHLLLLRDVDTSKF